MPTGDPRSRRLTGPAAAAALAAALLAGGCEVLKEPEVRVDLSASRTTLAPGESSQITATVTLDGEPLSGQELTFSATPAGGFPDGDTATTDLVGQAAAVYRVAADEVAQDTEVEVTATVTRGEQTVTGMISLLVDVAGSGGTR